MKNSLTALAAAACIALPAAAQQPKVSASPYLPSYGQPVTVEVRDTAWPTFTPATRYSINGSNVIVDFEYLTSGFGPMRPDFGYEPVNLGELVPGNYTLTARLHNIQTPGAAPLTVSSSLAVVPPGAWGLYTIPVEPQAFAATHVMVKSAAYFDPRTMRASISGNVVRVDFEYLATAPASGSAPAGMAAYGSVRIPDLAPGSYRLEGWGRVSGGAPEKFFTRDLVIASTTPVVEYYSASLDHYFMATGAGEIAALDRGPRATGSAPGCASSPGRVRPMRAQARFPSAASTRAGPTRTSSPAASRNAITSRRSSSSNAPTPRLAERLSSAGGMKGSPSGRWSR